jgi:P27 family predicted phage terminase small subunit
MRGDPCWKADFRVKVTASGRTCLVSWLEWNRIVGELIALGVLSKFDRGPLAIYCGAYAMWAEAMQAIEQFGSMIKSPNGFPVQSPYVAIVNRQAEVMLRIAGEFGFTPASRSRNFTFTKSNSMLLEARNEPPDEFGAV